MVYTTETLKFGRYLQCDFLYRVNGRWRKVMPTLKTKIQEMFNYKG